LNPDNEAGKIALISRMGADVVTDRLVPLAESVKRSGQRVLWVVDPMHGNTHVTSSGQNTRYFNEILAEVDRTFEAHAKVGTRLGGVHFEMTGEDVSECLGGDGAGLSEPDLDKNYASACDPRLNYRQSLDRMVGPAVAQERGLRWKL
jgi:3-deoxy-7-phosphoheptulonate synthase